MSRKPFPTLAEQLGIEVPDPPLVHIHKRGCAHIQPDDLVIDEADGDGDGALLRYLSRASEEYEAVKKLRGGLFVWFGLQMVTEDYEELAEFRWRREVDQAAPISQNSSHPPHFPPPNLSPLPKHHHPAGGTVAPPWAVSLEARLNTKLDKVQSEVTQMRQTLTGETKPSKMADARERAATALINARSRREREASIRYWVADQTATRRDFNFCCRRNNAGYMTLPKM
ncbi:hypothetical protein BDK51DRAFT_40350, partial [Blyttiomyces helicus]